MFSDIEKLKELITRDLHCKKRLPKSIRQKENYIVWNMYLHKGMWSDENGKYIIKYVNFFLII